MQDRCIIFYHFKPGLRISHHADKTLNSFCQWQAGIHNGKQKLHDHAVLLTGKDICSYKDAPCDTLGNGCDRLELAFKSFHNLYRLVEFGELNHNEITFSGHNTFKIASNFFFQIKFLKG